MEKVIHQFLAMVVVKRFEWPEGFAYSSAEQRQLIEMVVQHPICKEYPPSIVYQMHFLKHVMAEAEKHGHEIADEVYELYAILVAIPAGTEEKFCYKSYCLGEYGYVTLKESTQLISQGTTGLTTWQAAFNFVEWALQNKHFFNQKNVLELGAGLGFAGISVCKVCTPKSCYFTDCHAEVLDRLKENVKINLKGVDTTYTEVSEIDWNEGVSSFWSTHNQVDCIIATDVVYDKDIIDAFVGVLQQLLRKYTSAIAYVASTIRNEDTYKHFCTKLAEANLQRTILERSCNSCSLFYYDCSQTIELVQLRLEYYD